MMSRPRPFNKRQVTGMLALCTTLIALAALVTASMRSPLRMVTNGIRPSNDTLAAYESMTTSHKFQWIVFAIEGGEVRVEKTSPAAEEMKWDVFLEALTESGDPRYAVVDFAYEEQDQRRNKLVLIRWVDDDFPIRKKMMYIGSFDEFQKELMGIQKITQIYANNVDELEYEAVLRKVKASNPSYAI
mmetsp:Transcript_9383/g.24274  ORF Transcript_9383/g.24274 Transcript_9383/m.24274 type:complete len:187 (+) Transcript_9383:176-736(+)